MWRNPIPHLLNRRTPNQIGNNISSGPHTKRLPTQRSVLSTLERIEAATPASRHSFIPGEPRGQEAGHLARRQQPSSRATSSAPATVQLGAPFGTSSPPAGHPTRRQQSFKASTRSSTGRFPPTTEDLAEPVLFASDNFVSSRDRPARTESDPCN